MRASTSCTKADMLQRSSTCAVMISRVNGAHMYAFIYASDIMDLLEVNFVDSISMHMLDR